jgi:hypothetical protein
MSTPCVTVEIRFWEKVDDSGDCWEWLAARNPNGYGAFRVDGQMRRAHRVAYELIVGPIPPGLRLDHLCRNRGCVNPEHLEPVTQRENIIRGVGPAMAAAHQQAKTHCPQGHPYSPENTYYYAPTNGRHCRECSRQRCRRRRAQRQEIS